MKACQWTNFAAIFLQQATIILAGFLIQQSTINLAALGCFSKNITINLCELLIVLAIFVCVGVIIFIITISKHPKSFLPTLVSYS